MVVVDAVRSIPQIIAFFVNKMSWTFITEIPLKCMLGISVKAGTKISAVTFFSLPILLFKGVKEKEQEISLHSQIAGREKRAWILRLHFCPFYKTTAIDKKPFLCLLSSRLSLFPFSKTEEWRERSPATTVCWISAYCDSPSKLCGWVMVVQASQQSC